MKKRLLTWLLIFSIGTPVARASVSVVGGTCIMLGVGLTAFGVKYLIHRCDKKWYCVHDNEDTEHRDSRKCLRTTPREMRLNGFSMFCGPFNTGEACFDPCDNYTNSTHASSAAFVDEEEQPLTVIVQQSTNLVDWVNVATNYYQQVYFDTEVQVYEHPFTNSPGALFARVMILE